MNEYEGWNQNGQQNNMSGQANNFSDNQMQGNQTNYNAQNQNNASTIRPGMDNKPFVVKRQTNKTMIIAIGAIVVIGLVFFLLAKTGKNGIFGGDEEEDGVLKIETSQRWGDKYSVALQEYFYKDSEIEVNGVIKEKYQPKELGIAFIDFLFDGTPEMVVKYNDSLGKESIKIFVINNNEVSETKDFRNAEFKMVYSIKDKTLKWYIYIMSATTKKYGTYTLMEKILNFSALDSDIKTTTDVELTTFNVNYVSADYKTSYYLVDKDDLADDFKAAVLRYETTNSDVESARKAVLDNYGSIEYTENVDDKDYITVGEYTLNYGDYVAEIPITEKGEVTDVREEMITINKNGTVIIAGERYEFNVYNNLFVVDNKTFTVTSNDEFRYGTGEGNIYKYKE